MFDGGKIVRQIYDFSSNDGKTYEVENLNDFLVADDEKEYEKAGEFPSKYRLASTHYNFTPWHETPKKMNYTDFDIFITPENKTSFRFRDIFNNSDLTFKHAKEAKRWLDSPNLSYWSPPIL